MEDITVKDPSPNPNDPGIGANKGIAPYNASDFRLSYIEYFPEVTQRVFQFIAEDQLGNIAKVQRTIAIASAATLTGITTTEQNGIYPKDKVIELRANFDGMIKLENNTAGRRPKLNVLYQIGANYVVEQIECEPVTADTLYLTFNFRVPENAQGTLNTIYIGIPNKPAGYESIDRPITVDPSCRILDVVRGDPAYTPGNVTGFIWNSAAHSLQELKTIGLDGIIPTINSINIVNTKNAFDPGKWYLKAGESISFEVTVSKNIKITGNASLSFRLRRPNNAYSPATGYDTTNFTYRKVTANKIVFTLDVTKTTIPNDGILQNDITLVNAANITDDAGNPVLGSSFTMALNNTFSINNTGVGSGNIIFFDFIFPPKPVTTLTLGTAVTVGTNPSTTLYYGGTTAPYLGINTVPTADEPYGAETRQYSLDGGLNWVAFPTVKDGWTSAVTSPAGNLYISNGQWSLKTRYIDKAGNEGLTTDQLIHINSAFPKLLGVTVVQPNATYIKGNKLDFKLDFDDVVSVPATGVTLTVRDLTVTTNTPGSAATPSYEMAITATQVPETNRSRSVTFTWTLVENTKDMLNGLKVYALDISGLRDKFGNAPTGGISFSGNTSVTVNGTTVTYDFTGIKVSTIQPTVRSREPQNAQGRTGNITVFATNTTDQFEAVTSTIANGSISSDNKTITLTFQAHAKRKRNYNNKAARQLRDTRRL